MVRFDAAHGAVHYPPDRRFRIWIRPSILIGTGIAIENFEGKKGTLAELGMLEV